MRQVRISYPCSALVALAGLLLSKPAPLAAKHHVPDGFAIERASGEKQTRFPMFAAFDDKGRLFVAESSGLDLYAEITARTGPATSPLPLPKSSKLNGQIVPPVRTIRLRIWPRAVCGNDGRRCAANSELRVAPINIHGQYRDSLPRASLKESELEVALQE